MTENDLISQNKRLHIPTVVSFLDAAIYLESSKKFEQEVKRMTATKVGDICTRKVVTITEDTTLVDIATIMAEKKIHLLPVVKDGKVTGSWASATWSRPWLGRQNNVQRDHDKPGADLADRRDARRAA